MDASIGEDALHNEYLEVPPAAPLRVFSEPEHNSFEAIVQFTALRVRSFRTVDNAEKIMTESKHCSTHLPLWKAIRDINIIPKFDWWQDLSPDPQIPPRCNTVRDKE